MTVAMTPHAPMNLKVDPEASPTGTLFSLECPKPLVIFHAGQPEMLHSAPQTKRRENTEDDSKEVVTVVRQYHFVSPKSAPTGLHKAQEAFRNVHPSPTSGYQVEEVSIHTAPTTPVTRALESKGFPHPVAVKPATP